MAQGLLPKNAFKIRQPQLPAVPGARPPVTRQPLGNRIGAAASKAVQNTDPSQSSSVADNLTGLLDSNSKFTKAARTRTKQEFNRRGLVNSSMAVQAGEVAAINTALPIAQQDAAQSHASGLLSQDASLRLKAQTQAEGATEGLLDKDITGKLVSQTQAEGSKRELLDTDIAGQLTSQTQAEGSREGLLDTQLAGDLTAQTQQETAQSDIVDKQIAGNVALRNLDIASQQAIATMNVDSNDRDRATSISAIMLNSISAARTAINNNTAMPAAQRAIALEDLAEREQANLNLVEQLYEVDIQWPGSGDGGILNPSQGGAQNTPDDGGADNTVIAGDGTVITTPSNPDGSVTGADGSTTPPPDSRAAIDEMLANVGDSNPDAPPGFTADPEAIDNAIAGINSITNSFGIEVTGRDITSAVIGLGLSHGLAALGLPGIAFTAINALVGLLTGRSITGRLADLAVGESDPGGFGTDEDGESVGGSPSGPSDPAGDTTGPGHGDGMDPGDPDDPSDGDTSEEGEANDTDDAGEDEGNDPSEDSDESGEDDGGGAGDDPSDDGEDDTSDDGTGDW